MTVLRAHRRGGLPPGPAAYPVVGNLLQFRRDPTGFLTRLARQYGDVAAFRLGSQLAVQVNHPDLIRDVLVTNTESFTKTLGLDRASLVMGNGLVTSEGELHRRQRRLVQPALAKQKVLAYANDMVDVAQQMSLRWQDDQPVKMLAEMCRLTLAIAGRTLFGVDVEQDAVEIGRAMEIAFEYFNRLLTPLPRFLADPGWRHRQRFERARNYLDEMVVQMIRERVTSGADHGDLLSRLLLARDDCDGGGMSESQLRDEVMTMFLAGHETTATALTWTWYLLATHPEVEQEFHAELDTVLEGRAPTAEDIPQLQFTRLVLKEAMRLYPPVWALTRRAVEEYPLNGFILPAGTVVGMSQYVMHRDPRYYARPDCFLPHRWLSEQPDKHCYFPFGSGPRLCVGEQFAWMEEILLLATLGQHWQPRVASGFRPRFKPMITLRPSQGLPMVVSRRKPHRPKRPAKLAAVMES